MHRTLWQLALVWIAATAAFLILARGAVALEPSSEFLQGLRARGYYDVAQDYLEAAKTNPLVSEEFKQAIPYELGILLIEEARRIGDRALKFQKLDEAKEKLQAFIDANPDHPEVQSARRELAKSAGERGLAMLMLADREVDPNKKEALWVQARGYFAEAEAMYDKQVEDILAALRTLPAQIPANAPQFAVREQMRNDLIQARLTSAWMVYQSSKAAAEGSEWQKKELERAAATFKKWADKYIASNLTLGSGLTAQINEARCYAELGRHKDATSALYVVLSYENGPQIRNWKALSVPIAIDAYVAQKMFPEAIEYGNKFVAAYSGNTTKERNAPDVLEVNLHLARALKALHDYKPDAAQAKNALNQAREIARDGAKVPGPHQDGFRKLLEELGIGGAEPEQGPITSFAEAFKRANAALEQWDSVKKNLELARSNDPQKVPELEKQSKDSMLEAFGLYETALRLAGPQADVPVDDLNQARFLVAYFNLETGDLMDAAVVGDWLSLTYPEFSRASSAAKVAMLAYYMLYVEESEQAQKEKRAADTAFESDRVIQLADRIVSTWPQSAEAGDARKMLVAFSVARAHDAITNRVGLKEVVPLLAKAAEVANLSPEGSTDRASAEIRAGQAYWRAYQVEAIRPQEVRLSKQQLAPLLAGATRHLTSGVQQYAASESIDSTAALGALTLAQLYLATNQPDQAVATLEDAKTGGLTLVKADSPAVKDQDEFAADVYKAALQAYVTARRPDMPKAEEALQQLEKLLADDPEAEKKFSSQLLAIARRLQDQIEVAENPADKRAITQGFSRLLQKVIEAQGANIKPNVLRWAAATYYTLAEGVRGNAAVATGEAKDLYLKARAAFGQIVDNAENFQLDPRLVEAYRWQIALCNRRLGDYETAIKQMTDLIKKNPNILSRQMEIAHVYYEYGENGGEAKNYFWAFVGKKNDNVWGWFEMSKKLMDFKQDQARKDAFFEARYNHAKSMLAFGVAAGDERFVKAALDKSIKQTQEQATDMNGPQWKQKFDDLAKQIQQKLGEKQDGLNGL